MRLGLLGLALLVVVTAAAVALAALALRDWRDARIAPGPAGPRDQVDIPFERALNINADARALGPTITAAADDERGMLTDRALSTALSELHAMDLASIPRGRILLAVTTGPRPSGGYTLRVDSVTRREGRVTVEVTETFPTGAAAAVVTAPTDVVAIARGSITLEPGLEFELRRTSGEVISRMRYCGVMSSQGADSARDCTVGAFAAGVPAQVVGPSEGSKGPAFFLRTTAAGIEIARAGSPEGWTCTQLAARQSSLEVQGCRGPSATVSLP